MEKLWTPGQIGPMKTKNRTIRSATNEHLAMDGLFGEDWLTVYGRLAAGGVGTIITGQLAVDPTQRADEGQAILCEELPGIEGNRDVLRRGADLVHSWDARLVVQLSHPGLKAPEGVNGRPAKAPGDFTVDELGTLVKRFTFAAKLCRDSGVDGVQIHMAHGYLLSTFLDPGLNTRTDEYGGSLENRFRLCGEIIRGVRESCGADFAILVKIDCNACGDLSGLMKLCEGAGVDGAEVSGLDCGAHPGRSQAFYLEQVREVLGRYSLPVSLVGGIFSLDEARRVLDAGLDFVSFGRALICEPDLIRNMEQGEARESRCLKCCQCYKVYRQRPVRCVLHHEEIPHLARLFPGGK